MKYIIVIGLVAVFSSCSTKKNVSRADLPDSIRSGYPDKITQEYIAVAIKLKKLLREKNDSVPASMFSEEENAILMSSIVAVDYAHESDCLSEQYYRGCGSCPPKCHAIKGEVYRIESVGKFCKSKDAELLLFCSPICGALEDCGG